MLLIKAPHKMYLLDLKTDTLVEAEIVEANSKDIPLKKDGWNFNWRTILKKQNTDTYILRLKSNPASIQGVLHLKTQEGMLIMDLVEVAPHILDFQKNTRYLIYL